MFRLRILVVFALSAASVAFAGGASAQLDSPPQPELDGSSLANSALRDLVEIAADGGASAADELIVVEVHYNTTSADARAVTEAAGGIINGEVEGWLLQASVPLSSLAALEAEPVIDYLSIPGVSDPVYTPPAATSGPEQAVTGSHVVESNADEWLAAGWDGAGIKVGIVDYFNIGDWTSAEASGDLPAVSGTFCRSNGSVCSVWGSGDHGNNVAEIIHDMAPGAELYIAEAASVADLQAAIDYFDTQGVDIVSRSLTARYDGPGDGTGPMAAVVDDAVSKGMVFLNSAGNNASPISGQGSYWRGSWVDADGDNWLDFAPGDEDLLYTCAYTNGLRWSDWGDGAATNYDAYVFSGPNTTGTLISSSTNSQPTADPLELPDCSSGDNYLRIWLGNAGGGTAGDVLEFMTNGRPVERSQNPYSASGPASDTANPGALTVGAIDPATGDTIATYSAWGPTNDGRIKPSMSAQAKVVTSISSGFNGTSASTPVLAGAAALVLQSGRATTPTQVVSYLTNQASSDRGVAGIDNVYGTGELLLPTPCTPDFYEDNDTQGTATGTANGIVVPNLSICSGDDDWYSLRIAEGTEITVDLTFNDALGDLELALFDPSGTGKVYATSSTDNETITHTALMSGVYAAKVYGHLGSENTYEIELSRSICPADDAYEPNGTIGTATPMTDGVTLSAIACDVPGGGIYNLDWYSLAVDAGDTITAITEFPHLGANLNMALYNPAGTVQLRSSTSTTDDESITYVATEKGSYGLLVWGPDFQETTYDVTMSATCLDDNFEDNDTRATATAATNGATTSGIACAADDDWYSLPVAAGLDVTVDLAFTHAYGDVDVRLFDPAGVEVDQSRSSTDDESLTYTALSSGLYTARVYGHAGAQNTYDVTMSKSICPSDDTYEQNDSQGTATPMADGVTLAAILCDTDWFSIPVVAGETVSADVEFVQAGGNLSIALYNPSGTTQVANSVSNTDNESVTHVATETGDYGLLVWGAGNDQNVYDVTMSSVCTDDAYEENDTRLTATALTNDVAVNAHVCSGDDDWFSIPATSGQLVTAVVDFVDVDGDIDIRLFDPSGSEVDYSTSTSDGESITWSATQTGDYTLRVYGYNGAENDYTVLMKAGAHPLIRPYGVVVNPEGDIGSQIVQMTVFLEDANGDPYSSPTPVSVNWQTGDIASNPSVAHPGSDFVAASGTLTFAPGQTEASVPIEVLGDTVDEPPLLYGEWGLVQFLAPSVNAKINYTSFFGLGLMIIIDDD